jgi:pimeloyl-ACP methyl ester carboxylesterase
MGKAIRWCCCMEDSGAAKTWSRFGRELAKRFRVIARDRRGHGRTADVEVPITYDNMAADSIAFMEAIQLPKAHLVGYSDGGILCLLIALQRPDLVSRMVPVSANFHYERVAQETKAMFGSVTPEVLKMMIPELVSYYEKNRPDGPEHFPVAFEKIKHMIMTEPTLTVEELSNISVPTMVLAADRDLMTIEHTVALFEAIPNAQLCIIPGATHGLAYERSDEVSRAAVRFLKA